MKEFKKNLPKPCQECDRLKCVQPYMDGSGYYECMSPNLDCRKEFRQGKCCCQE